MLLNNVRQMEQYRQGFYVDIMTGSGGQRAAQRPGGQFGGAGFEGFTGVGTVGFGGGGGGGAGGGGGPGRARSAAITWACCRPSAKSATRKTTSAACGATSRG